MPLETLPQKLLNLARVPISKAKPAFEKLRDLVRRKRLSHVPRTLLSYITVNARTKYKLTHTPVQFAGGLLAVRPILPGRRRRGLGCRPIQTSTPIFRVAAVSQSHAGSSYADFEEPVISVATC